MPTQKSTTKANVVRRTAQPGTALVESLAPNPILPSNAEAEQAVLGSILIDMDALSAVVPILKERDFYFEKHQWVYAACIHLRAAHSPIDFLTVVSELEQRGQLNDIGGAAYLTSLINAVPTALHVEQYARLVRRAAVLRRIIRAATEIAALGYDPADHSVEEVLARASQIITALSFDAMADDGQTIGEAMNATLTQVEAYAATPRDVWGIPTKFDLDHATGGWHSGQLFVLSGDPGSGKTAWLLDAAINAAQAGHRGVIFSLEMSALELMLRLLSSRTNINTFQIKRGRIDDDALARIARTSGELGELPLRIYDMPTDTMTMAAKAARLVQQGQCDFVVIDYSKMVLDDGDQEALRLGAIARAVKNLAKQLHVATVLVHPSTRGPAQQGRQPDMTDLGWSWDVVYHADTIVFTWRDPKLPKEDRTRELVIVKNRNGPTMPVKHTFDPTLTRWGNLAHADIES